MTSEKQIKWDSTYIQIAKLIASHSHDPKYKVGAIIVNDANGAIVGLGYNGRGKGRPNQRLSMETGRSGFAHAEMNAISRVSWEMNCSYTLYSTLSPCEICAALILNNPIKRVVYAEKYLAGEDGLNEIVEGLGQESVLQLLG